MGREDQGIANSLQRWQTIPRALCFVLHGDGDAAAVLLLRGAPTKRIWANKLNGVGGHIERDEDIKAAALREIHEETGLQVTNLRLCGIVQIDSGAPVGIMMFVWTARTAERTTRPCDEGSLEWHSIHDLPTADLVDDLAILLPRVLASPASAGPFFAHYSYDEANQLQIAWHGETKRV
jgi:8-oxo-dGTP diphosphatase